VKQAIIAILLLVAGGVAGALIAKTDDGSRGNRSGGAERPKDYTLQASADLARIAELEKEIAALRAALEGQPKPESAWPNDSLESIEMALENAYAENNVDWLLEVIERLLLMGEPGFPMLRRLIEDIGFKGKFLPGQNEFRMDQIYTAGKVFTKHEREFIGFLNYLLIDNRTVPIMRQGAMMGAAFYVGSAAPGSEELRATLIRQFLEEEGMGNVMGIPMMPKQMQEKMQVMAMAMSGDKAMIPVLQDRLRTSKDEKSKSDIIGALAYLGDESMLPTIQERLKPEGGDFRKEIDALARIDSPESHDTAAKFLVAIPNSKNFYRHATRYVRGGGGTAGVMLIQERVKRDPSDPEVKNAIGTLSRYPTQESLDTLNLIADGADDDKTKERATKAAEDITRKMSGEMLTEAGKK
jgi:hypothetical protein